MADEVKDPGSSSTPPPPTGSGGSEVEAGKLYAALSYLWILCFLPYFMDDQKSNSFTMFHAKQGVVLFILNIVAMMIAAVPCIGWVIAPIVLLALFVLAVIGFIKAINGEKWEMPGIGKLVKTMNL